MQRTKQTLFRVMAKFAHKAFDSADIVKDVRFPTCGLWTISECVVTSTPNRTGRYSSCLPRTQEALIGQHCSYAHKR